MKMSKIYIKDNNIVFIANENTIFDIMEIINKHKFKVEKIVTDNEVVYI